MNVTIEQIAEHHIEGFRAALDAVAQERRYLARTKAPSEDSVRQFVCDNIESGNPQFVAVRDDTDVVGWCDIVRLKNPLTQHTGILGMGVRAEARGQGIGTALLTKTLKQAWAKQFVRIELIVFANNPSAIALYERAGFGKEGELIDAAIFDGEYANSYVMGLVKR